MNYLKNRIINKKREKEKTIGRTKIRGLRDKKTMWSLKIKRRRANMASI